MLTNQTFNSEVIMNCHYLSSHGKRTPSCGKHGKGTYHPKRGFVLGFRCRKGYRTDYIKWTVKEVGNSSPRDLEENKSSTLIKIMSPFQWLKVVHDSGIFSAKYGERKDWEGLGYDWGPKNKKTIKVPTPHGVCYTKLTKRYTYMYMFTT